MYSEATSELIKVFLALYGVAICIPYRRLRIVNDRAPSGGGFSGRGAILRFSLVFAALLSICNYYRFDYRSIVEDVHSYDSYFYYVGSKYFCELGFDDLYPATLIADRESRHRLRHVLHYREQPGQKVVPVQEAFERTTDIVARFSPERWEGFKQDIEHYVNITPARSWLVMLTDYGYNATPVSLWIMEAAANLLDAKQIKWAGYCDLLLLLAAILVVRWACGADCALLATLYLFVSYSGRWPPFGTSLLRTDWLAAMIVSWCLLHKGRPLLGGCFMGYACCVRIFPAIFLLGLLVKAVVEWMKGLHWRSAPTRFLAGSIATVVVLCALVWGQRGGDIFSQSVDKLSRYADEASLMPGHVGFGIGLAWLCTDAGKDSKLEFLRDHGLAVTVGAVLLLCCLAVCMMRSADDEAVSLGEIAFYLLTTILYYYHITRVLLVIVHVRRSAHSYSLASLCSLFTIEAVSFLLRYLSYSRQTIGGAISVMIGAYAVLMILLMWRAQYFLPLLAATGPRAERLVALTRICDHFQKGILGVILCIAVVGAMVAVLARPNVDKASGVSATPPVTNSSRLLEVVLGTAEGSTQLAELRSNFAPHEIPRLIVVWKRSDEPLTAAFEWWAPDGTVAYRKELNVQAEWTRTWTDYRGKRPLPAGKWSLRVSAHGGVIGQIDFNVVRKSSLLPHNLAAQASDGSRLTLQEASALGLVIRKYLADELTAKESPTALPPGVGGRKGQVAVAFFHHGELLYTRLAHGESFGQSLASAVAGFIPRPEIAVDEVDIELSVVQPGMKISAGLEHLATQLRGNVGFSIRDGAREASLLPTAIFRENRNTAEEILRQLCIDAGLKESAWREGQVELSTFQTQEFVMRTGADHCVEFICGRRSILPREVTHAALTLAIDRAVQWYVYNQHEDGRFMYRFLPAENRDPGDDWCLRQLNALFVLAELAQTRPENAALRASIRKACDMYVGALVVSAENAFLDWQHPRKDSGLGSSSFLLATLATLNQPTDRATMKKVANAIIGEQEISGRFSTDFVKSEDRRVDQRYYPGEAMLALLRYYGNSQDQRCLASLELAFSWYQDYWEDHEKTAPFVPWQVRCFGELCRIRPDRRYCDYCFGLQDWLLEKHPPLSPARGLDLAGALSGALSSTGVYAEGLAEAYRLAREVGDVERRQRYGTALAGCMRYLLSLQFKEGDVYWARQPGRMIGAVATNPRDNALRLDFTYHAVSAMHAVTQLFTPEEWDDLLEQLDQ